MSFIYGMSMGAAITILLIRLQYIPVPIMIN